MAQQVKSLLWLRSLLWYGFTPWPRNFHMLLVRQKTKKNQLFLTVFLVTPTYKTDEVLFFCLPCSKLCPLQDLSIPRGTLQPGACLNGNSVLIPQSVVSSLHTKSCVTLLIKHFACSALRDSGYYCYDMYFLIHLKLRYLAFWGRLLSRVH